MQQVAEACQQFPVHVMQNLIPMTTEAAQACDTLVHDTLLFMILSSDLLLLLVSVFVLFVILNISYSFTLSRPAVNIGLSCCRVPANPLL